MWITVGIDPFREIVTILGCASTEPEAKEHHKRADDPRLVGDDGNYPYRRSFDFLNPQSPREFHQWLVHHKIPNKEALFILKQFGDAVRKLMTEWETGSCPDSSPKSPP